MKKSIYLLALTLVFLPAIASAQLNIDVLLDGSAFVEWDEANSIAIQGDYAYVTDGEVGMHVVNITDPENLIEVGISRAPGYTRKVVVEGDYAYLANVSKGLLVVDITDPESPMVITGVQIDGRVNDIAIDGNFAYVTGEEGTLNIVEIIDPTKPRLISSTVGFGALTGIKVAGDYAYLSGHYTDYDTDIRMGVRVVDISNPASPKQVGELFFGSPETTMDFDIADGFIYFGYGNDLMVINTQIIDSPTPVVSVPASLKITDVKIIGDYAYVVDYDGILVFDISDRNQPSLETKYETPVQLSEGAEVAFSEEYAFITDAIWGLMVVEMSDPGEENVDQDRANAMNVRPDNAAVLRVAALKAYPNPFNPLLTAAVNLQDQSELRISLFNQLGQEVAVLADGNYAAGEQSFTLDARKMATGNYYLRAVGTGGLNEVQRVTLMK